MGEQAEQEGGPAAKAAAPAERGNTLSDLLGRMVGEPREDGRLSLEELMSRAGRRGPAFLMQAGKTRGFHVTLVDAFRDSAAEVISSSRIRDRLHAGHLTALLLCDAEGARSQHTLRPGTAARAQARQRLPEAGLNEAPREAGRGGRTTHLCPSGAPARRPACGAWSAPLRSVPKVLVAEGGQVKITLATQAIPNRKAK